MEARRERLVAKLDRLAALDAARRTFGAATHGYRREPVGEAALARLEATTGFALPEAYRDWLRHVGSGAGPDHGLMAPEVALARMREIEDGSGGLVGSPPDITGAHFEAQAARVREGVPPGDCGITADTMRGVLPISHQGCNGYSVLLLAGPFTGGMLGECEDCVGEPWTAATAFWPAGRPPDRLEPPTFHDWIEAWLDRSLAGFG